MDLEYPENLILDYLKLLKKKYGTNELVTLVCYNKFQRKLYEHNAGYGSSYMVREWARILILSKNLFIDNKE